MKSRPAPSEHREIKMVRWIADFWTHKRNTACHPERQMSNQVFAESTEQNIGEQIKVTRQICRKSRPKIPVHQAYLFFAAVLRISVRSPPSMYSRIKLTCHQSGNNIQDEAHALHPRCKHLEHAQNPPCASRHWSWPRRTRPSNICMQERWEWTFG